MGSKYKWIYTLLIAFIVQFSFAQEKTITGTVTDANGPVPGVNVVVKGTSKGVSTGFDGKYSIRAKEGENLIFSFMGMNDVVKTVGTGSEINTKMSDESRQLVEVVVVAQGIKKKDRAIGYANTKVNSEDLTRVGNTNLLTSLGGKVSGLQTIASGGAPGQASRLVIRGGNKSITNSNEPLYVIDGVPVSNSNDGNGNTVTGIGSPNRIIDINPNDIENVTILKGANGAVLYGNRGSNGVILITTKSGKTKSGKAIVEYNSIISMEDPLKLPDFQYEYAQGTNRLIYAEGTSRSFGPRITGQTVNSTAAGAIRGLGPQPIVLKSYDPRKEFLKTGLTYGNNISVANSNEKTNMFFSAGQNKQTSIVPNQFFQTFNLKFNGSHNFSDKFNAGLNLIYSENDGDLPFTGQDGSNPFFALFHVPTSWNLSEYGYERPDNGNQINFRGGSFDNPLWTVNKNFANSKAKRSIGSVNLNYTLTDWMKLTYRLGKDISVDNRKLFRDLKTGGSPLGRLVIDDVTREETTSTFLATINKTFKEKYSFDLTVGQDYNERKVRNTTFTGTELVLPKLTNTNNIKTFDPSDEFNSRRTLFGVFGDLTLGYNNYFFVNLLGRNEWSSTLPADNRSYFYSGVNSSFVFSELIKSKNIISYGKIRAGLSKTGRDAPVYSILQPLAQGAIGDGFTTGIAFPYNGLAGYTIPNTINNPILKPEFTTEKEIGIEVKTFNNRLGLDFTYFENLNEDGIINLDITPSSGATGLIINSGKTSSEGIELALNTTPIKTDNFSWDVNLNFSKIKSNVDETYPGIDRIFLGGFGGNPAIYAVKGERYGSIIGSAYAKDANGNILVGNNGVPLTEDGKNLGYVEPDWTGGLNTTLKYKGLYLTGSADLRRGGKIYNGTEQLMDFYGVTNKTLHREDDYVFPGVNSTTGNPNTVVVKRDANWYGGPIPNEEYVYENNWIKLRELSLGYSFSPKGVPVNSVNISFYGRNLFLWSDVPHIDPESSAFGTGNAQGASRFNFPTTRSLGFNLKVIF